MRSTDGWNPVTISALGKLRPADAAQAKAIGQVNVGGDVLRARILAGYDLSLNGVNGDATMRAVVVGGDWSASNLVAGVVDLTGDGFGRNDAIIAGGRSGNHSRIGRVEIGGEVQGSASLDEHFGFVAEQIVRFTIGGTALPLTHGKGNDLTGIDLGATLNASVRELADPLTLDLSQLGRKEGFKILGAGVNDGFGYSLSAAGDINGDGLDDFVLGASGADDNGDSSGAVYVVFGRSGNTRGPIDVSALNGTNGFAIFGQSAGDFVGASVSAAGDINGDGFDDLAIGAPGADANGPYSGAVYVLFGKAGGFSAQVDLATLDGAAGFTIRGGSGAHVGGSVSSAGDVNGDGFDDLLVGSYGNSFLIFGKAGPSQANLDLSSLDGQNGFRIVGASSSLGGGDVNGDGFSDLILSGRPIDGNFASFVIFGGSAAHTPELELGAQDGITGFQIPGYSVDGVADVNGDGFTDLLIAGDDSYSQKAYVVFGKSGGFASSVDVTALNGADGFVITAERSQRNFESIDLNNVGDINGDGNDDLVLRSYYGPSHVIYGRREGFGRELNVATLNAATGFRIVLGASGYGGDAISSAGDVNGDGFDDFLVGASDSYGVGAAYLIYGRGGVSSPSVSSQASLHAFAAFPGV